MLTAGVGGLVCWKHTGRSGGVPQLAWGSHGELQPAAATKAEESKVLQQQHFLIVLAGAGDGGQACGKVLPHDHSSSSLSLLLLLCRGPH